ncbi:MAG: phytanoyl-CoA dioxygenase family protein [Pseudomonadota bacterium]
MLNLDDHKNELDARGIARIEGLIPEPGTRAALELICALGSDCGLLTPQGWRQSDGRFALDKTFRGAIRTLVASKRFPNFLTHAVLQLTENLVGEPVTPMPPGQQILFTLPGAPNWFAPHDAWHVDAARLGPLGAPGLQIFALLDDVPPQGGGTLVVAGSHRLFNTSDVIRSKDLKRRLEKEAYFAWLFDAKREPLTTLADTAGAVGDVELSIVELTGRRGDVFFMDLRTLHTPAPNASNSARVMLTCRLPRTAVASKIFSP